MNHVLYKNRCKCKETLLLEKKPKINSQSKGKPVEYPTLDGSRVKTFQIPYNYHLSLEAKLILNSFQKKYFYHAIDDILYTLNLNLNERENLLALLYAPAISLHNTISVDFFDIWIHELYVNKISKANRFLTIPVPSSYEIIIKVLYKIKKPSNKKQILW